MTFEFSHRSIVNMIGLNPNLPPVVQRALQVSCIDFGVLCGLRSVTDQKKAVAAGKSKTMRSRHLTGHAVDLGAFVDGKLDWAETCYHQIAAAMHQAARELKVALVWGGAWDREVADLDPLDLAGEAAAYTAREHAKGVENPLCDLEHFELARRVFP